MPFQKLADSGAGRQGVELEWKGWSWKGAEGYYYTHSFLGTLFLTLVRSTPVRALTETGSSANRRLTSPVTRLPSPLKITISLVLERGAATLPAI